MSNFHFLILCAILLMGFSGNLPTTDDLVYFWVAAERTALEFLSPRMLDILGKLALFLVAYGALTWYMATQAEKEKRRKV